MLIEHFELKPYLRVKSTLFMTNNSCEANIQVRG